MNGEVTPKNKELREAFRGCCQKSSKDILTQFGLRFITLVAKIF